MRRYLTFLAPVFFATVIGAASAAAANAAPTFDITMFPPVTGSCVQGQPNLLVWDGQTQVRCVPIPTCVQYPAGTAAPAPGYPFTTSQFLAYQNGALKCVNPQCPFPQVSQRDAQTNSVVCVDPPSP